MRCRAIDESYKEERVIRFSIFKGSSMRHGPKKNLWHAYGLEIWASPGLGSSQDCPIYDLISDIAGKVGYLR